MSEPLTFRVGAGQRALGLFVLLAVAGSFIALGFDLPWPSLLVLGIFGVASLVSTVGNFGDRLHVDAEGLVLENVLLGRVGLRRPRRAAWKDVLAAGELNHKTLFLTVEGQRKWVLDAFEGLDLLRRLLEEHGVSVDSRTRPRLRDMVSGSRDVPPS